MSLKGLGTAIEAFLMTQDACRMLVKGLKMSLGRLLMLLKGFRMSLK